MADPTKELEETREKLAKLSSEAEILGASVEKARASTSQVVEALEAAAAAYQSKLRAEPKESRIWALIDGAKRVSDGLAFLGVIVGVLLAGLAFNSWKSDRTKALTQLQEGLEQSRIAANDRARDAFRAINNEYIAITMECGASPQLDCLDEPIGKTLTADERGRLFEVVAATTPADYKGLDAGTLSVRDRLKQRGMYTRIIDMCELAYVSMNRKDTFGLFCRQSRGWYLYEIAMMERPEFRKAWRAVRCTFDADFALEMDTALIEVFRDGGTLVAGEALGVSSCTPGDALSNWNGEAAAWPAKFVSACSLPDGGIPEK